MALTQNDISINIDAGQPNKFIDDYFLQKNTDKNFHIKITKNNQIQTISDTVKPILHVLYSDENNKLIAKDILKPTNNDGAANPAYNIAIANNEIIIPGQEMLTRNYGITKLVLEIDDIERYYTYSISYNVAKNYAVIPTTVISDLPTLEDKADRDLSNVDNIVFKSKALAAGLSHVDDLNANVKYFEGPSSLTAARLRYDPASKNWIFEVKEAGVYKEKFRVGQSAIVDVLRLIEGVKPVNIPSDELALYNKGLLINGKQAIRPYYVLPDGSEYGFVVHDSNTDKVVFRNNAGQLIEIPLTGTGGADTAEQIRDKLQSLVGDKMFSAKYIKDIHEALKVIDGGGADSAFSGDINGGGADGN